LNAHPSNKTGRFPGPFIPGPVPWGFGLEEAIPFLF
jgi:hypothetical protein